MAFITDQELQDLKDQVHKAEEATQSAKYLSEKAVKDEKENSRKFKIATIILGILAALGIAGTVYFMYFGTTGMISEKEHKSEVEVLENKISELEVTLQNVSMNQELDANANEESAGSIEDELVYAVQIGAFEEKNLSMYSDNFVNFKEIKSEGYNKYALGNFETLEEAKRFRRELVKLGFRNAFIGSYQNGKRIKIEEAW